MKHLTECVLFAAMSLVAIPAFAQQSSLAIVDFEQAVVESDPGQKALADFNKRQDELTKDIDALQKKIAEDTSTLRVRGGVLSETVKAQLTKDIKTNQTEMERKMDDATKELDDLKDRLLGPIANVAKRLLMSLAAEKGYYAVWDLSDPRTNVVYYDRTLSITEELKKRISQEMKTAAAAAPRQP